MDCVEGMKQIESNSIDLTVTSPPYDSMRNYKGFSWNFEEVAKQLYRITKPGGVVVWVVGDETSGKETLTSFRQAIFFDKIGFWMHDTMIYKKYAPPFPSINRYYQVFEYMFVLSKDGPPKTVNLLKDRKNKWIDWNCTSIRTRKKDGTIVERPFDKKIKKYGVRFNIWEYKTGLGHSATDDVAKGHPAIFPELLAKDHIKSWSNLGDLVLDPFMGSGTTAEACKSTMRNYIGFEISKEYMNISKKRLEVSSVDNWIKM